MFACIKGSFAKTGISILNLFSSFMFFGVLQDISINLVFILRMDF